MFNQSCQQAEKLRPDYGEAQPPALRTRTGARPRSPPRPRGPPVTWTRRGPAGAGAGHVTQPLASRRDGAGRGGALVAAAEAPRRAGLAGEEGAGAGCAGQALEGRA